MSQTAERALELLDVIAEAGKPVGLTNLAKMAGMPKSTVHRLAQVLADFGYVHHNEQGQYSLGMKFISMANRIRQGTTLQTVARPFIERLAVETGETVNLAVMNATEIVYLDQIQSERAVRAIGKLGFTGPVHSTSLGKAMLAHLSEEFVDKIATATGLPRMTDSTITDLDSLKRELATVRKRGYALDDQENEPEVICVGAPVFDANGVVAAISISAPAYRMGQDHISHYSSLLIKATSELSMLLGRV